MPSNKFLGNKELFLLLFIILAGAFLRLYHLDWQSLWLDEAFSISESRTIAGLFPDSSNYLSPPLYYILLYSWMSLFGDSEFALRLLSCAFGVMLIPLVFAAGSVVFDRKTGLYAALFTALSPIHIYYSQEARMYSLLSLLSLLSFFLLYLAIEKKKSSYWIAYVFTTILCLYTHYYAVFILFGEICFYVFFHLRQRGLLKKFLCSLSVILTAYIPLALVAVRQRAMDMSPWIQPPGLKDLGSTFLHLSFLSWRLPLWGVAPLVLKIAVPVTTLIFLAGLAVSWKRRTFLPVYVVIPVAAAFVLSFWMPVYVAGRYDMSVFPGFCLVIAAGLNSIKPRPLRLSFLAVIVISAGLILYYYYFSYKKSSDREVSQYIQAYAQRQDVIIVTELNITPFKYYWKRGCPPWIFQFPFGSPAFLSRATLEQRPGCTELEIEKLTKGVYPLLNENNRLWLVYHPMAHRLLRRLSQDLKNAGIVEFAPGDNANQAGSVHIFKLK